MEVDNSDNLTVEFSVCFFSSSLLSLWRELGDQRHECGRGTSTHNHRRTLTCTLGVVSLSVADAAAS